MRTYYIVFASHPSPAYRAEGARIRVSEGISPEGKKAYYAFAHPWGCGKHMSTPEFAIESLLRDNGCSDIFCECVGTESDDS